MTLPKGNITEAELLEDIQQRTNGRPKQFRKRPRKGKEGFPLDVFPLKLQELLAGAETALGINQDFAAAGVLFAVSIATGATYQLEVKKGYNQRAVLYLALVGLPNSNKSAALKFPLKPIFARQATNFKEFKAALDAFETEQTKPKKEREEIEKPVFHRYLFSDSTPEALISIHEDNPKGVGLYRDELAGWFKDFNRYRQGSDQEFWLQSWALVQIIVDRVMKGPTLINLPHIPVAGTIQPGTLEEITKDGRAVNGFIDRILFIWPEEIEKPDWTGTEINLHLQEAYQTALEALLNLDFEAHGQPNTLKLTSEARSRLFQFFNEDNKALCTEAENELLQGIYGKFDIHAQRLVIVLHLLSWAYWGEGKPPPEVNFQTVENAIRVAKYFRKQALRVYERLNASSPADKLPRDRRTVYEALPETFKTGDGVAIAKKKGMAERTFKDWLKNDRKLFEKLRHGQYEKKYS